MKQSGITLGIDTAAGVAAAAVGNVEHGVATTDAQALEGLLPCVRRALAAAGRELRDVSAIAVCAGPGSFTGLRIGVAFAKSLAQALGIAAIGVSSFDVVASLRTSAEDEPPQMTVVEGKRKFYYARINARDGAAPIGVAGDRDALLTAAKDALGEAAGELEVARAFSALTAAPDIRAVEVAALGRAALQGGADGDWRRLVIEYGQRPNAVVNWELRHGRA
jgi:tRNA threonylcarbamoyladenosine biosynthesis protein TsaB